MTKITNIDYEYKEETSKIQDSNESVDNYETLDTLRGEYEGHVKEKLKRDGWRIEHIFSI